MAELNSKLREKLLDAIACKNVIVSNFYKSFLKKLSSMKFLIVIPVLLISFTLKSQENNPQFLVPQAPIPVEVMVGAKSTMYQMIVDKRFVPGSRFKFFNLISYEVDENEFTPDSYIIQSIGYFEFAKRFDIGVGGNLKAFGGFKPIVSVQYTNFSREKGIIIQPVYEVHKDGEFSTLAMFEWHPAGDKKIQPYFKVQGLTAWANEHSFSYHNWRLGAQYKIFRFGPALNVQYHGGNAVSSVNWGCFAGLLIN